jgi:hypothetical protein
VRAPLVAGLLFAVVAAVDGDAHPVADGFGVVAETAGVRVYRKDYAGGEPDFVVVADLTRARIDSLVGDIVAPGTGEGPLGGDNPTIQRIANREAWNRAEAADADTFAVLNGQFFNNSGEQVSLAFAVFSDGRNISDGYGTTSEFPGQIRLLRVDHAGDSARIDMFDESAFEAVDGYDHRLAGLDVAADKGPTRLTGRTFIGVRDDDGDGAAELVMVFASSYATQPGAADVLSAFGANAQMMLDGGGSTQLIVDGADYVSSSRTLPHFLVISSDPEPPFDPGPDAGADAGADAAADAGMDGGQSDSSGSGDDGCPEARMCEGLECGPDAFCGLSCGTCGVAQTCVEGQCIARGAEPNPHDASGGIGPDVADITGDSAAVDGGLPGEDARVSSSAGCASTRASRPWAAGALLAMLVAERRRRARHGVRQASQAPTQSPP